MADEIIKLIEYLMSSELVQSVATVYLIGLAIMLLITVAIFIFAGFIIVRAFRRTSGKKYEKW